MSLVALCLWPFRQDIAALMTQDAATQAQIVAYLEFNLLSTPLFHRQHRHGRRHERRGGHPLQSHDLRRRPLDRPPCRWAGCLGTSSGARPPASSPPCWSPRSCRPSACSMWSCTATGRALPCTPTNFPPGNITPPLPLRQKDKQHEGCRLSPHTSRPAGGLRRPVASDALSLPGLQPCQPLGLAGTLRAGMVFCPRPVLDPSDAPRPPVLGPRGRLGLGGLGRPAARPDGRPHHPRAGHAGRPLEGMPARTGGRHRRPRPVGVPL